MVCLVQHKMTPIEKVVVVKLDDTIRFLKQKLREKGHRTAVVLNTRRTVAGVITVKDLQFAGDDNYIEDWYSTPAYTITADAPIEKARQKLNEYKNHQLIVVDDRNKPLGILWDFDAVLGCDDEFQSDNEKKRE